VFLFEVERLRRAAGGVEEAGFCVRAQVDYRLAVAQGRPVLVNAHPPRIAGSVLGIVAGGARDPAAADGRAIRKEAAAAFDAILAEVGTGGRREQQESESRARRTHPSHHPVPVRTPRAAPAPRTSGADAVPGR